jgi:ABC-type transport system substrate-binding protein
LRRFAALVVILACGGPRRGEQVSIRLALADPLLPVALRVREGVRTSEAQDLVFETLVSFDEQGEMVPGLADRFERRDASHYRVHLRPALLSDGTPLVVDDVIASLAQNRLQARRDGDWLEVESADPGAPLDIWLQEVPIGRQTLRGAIGTGPFLAAHEDGSQAVYRRVVPKAGAVNELVFINYASDRSAFAHALRGDANLLWLSDPKLLELFEGVPGMQVVRAPGSTFTAAAFNLRRFDRAERRALVDALRPDTISALTFGDGCRPRPTSASVAPLPPGRP